MYPDLRSIPLCYPDTNQTIYKCCSFNYLGKQSQLESKKPDYDHLKVPPFCVCDELPWPTNLIFMIQCKFGEKSRQVNPFCVTKDFDQSCHSCLNFFSPCFCQKLSGRSSFCAHPISLSSFLPILSHYLPSLSLMEKRSQAVWRCFPFSGELTGMMVSQGCKKYWFTIETDIQLLQHAATGDGFLPVILLPVSSLSFRMPDRSCIFCPSYLAKLNTKYNTIFYINICDVFFLHWYPLKILSVFSRGKFGNCPELLNWYLVTLVIFLSITATF